MKHYKNLFINQLNTKDVDHFTTDTGLFLRRKTNGAFRKLCNIFTNATIIREDTPDYASDEEYYGNLKPDRIPLSNYPLSTKKNANNIVVERYPNLDKDESYIFVGTHVCPEDIETMLNIIDRNAYLILGSVETLNYNPEAYLSWLNGMIVFGVLNQKERSALSEKMERVLQTQSILIFPEGSHNYDLNRLIKPLYDGPVNLALKTGKKIVPVALVKDYENNVAYLDVGNPIDVRNLDLNIQDYYPGKEENEKYRIKSMSSYVRDQMATAVYHMMERHLAPMKRNEYGDIGQYFVDFYVTDTFRKLNWKHDVFEAEYLTKKTDEEREYEAVVRSLSVLRLKKNVLKETSLNSREYIQKKNDLDKKNVAENLRRYFYEKVVFELKYLNKLNRKYRRGIGLLLSYLTAIIVISLFMQFVLPQLVDSIVGLANNIPQYVNDASHVITEISEKFNLESKYMNMIVEKWNELLNYIITLLTNLIPVIGNFIMTLGSSILNVIIGIIVSIYILIDKEKFIALSRKVTFSIFSAERSKRIVELAQRSNETFGKFLSGKILDSLIIGILTFIILTIFKMPYILLISVVIGITNIIPFFGPFFGAIPSAIIILCVSPIKALWFIGIILVIQQIDGNIIGPKILGDSIGISAFWILFSLLIFAKFLGLIGMIIGVPIFAIIYSIIKENVERRLKAKGLPVETEKYK